MIFCGGVKPYQGTGGFRRLPAVAILATASLISVATYAPASLAVGTVPNADARVANSPSRLSPRNESAAPASANANVNAAEDNAAGSTAEDALGAAVPGPAHVTLEHGASIELPSGQAFLPAEPAKRALEKMGNLHNENLLGIVFDAGREELWFVTVRYDAEGYIKDDESIDADELLKAIREGTDAANEERKQRGFQTFQIEGWTEPPHYDKSAHRLIWALVASAADGRSVNYNTRLLGRHGVLSLNLVTEPEQLSAQKPRVSALLAGTSFTAGERYEDFSSSTDKVAEYGLSGLVLAGAGLGAVKLLKIGLLAKFWNVFWVGLLAAKKFALLGVAGLIAWLKRVLGGKQPPPDQPPSELPPSP